MIASPLSLFIINFPPLNSNKPSESIAALLELIIYCPSEASKIRVVLLPPFIASLQNPFISKISSFLKETILFFFIFMTAHSPSVNVLFSKSFNVVFPKFIILTSFKLLVIIIGAFFSEVKNKSCKNNVTELDLITMFPSSDSPVTK